MAKKKLIIKNVKSTRASTDNPSRVYSKTRPDDKPQHVDPKTGKPYAGKRGKPEKIEAQDLKQKSTRIQAEVLRFFEEGHLNTGDFQKWVRMSRTNTHNFYKWIVCDLLPKNVALTIQGGDTENPADLPFVVKIAGNDPNIKKKVKKKNG